MSLQTVQKWYPNAKTTEDTVNKLLDVIENELGLKPNQLMHADSMCCDDVNAIQYPPRAYEMLGPFHMGGLNGYPFAGVTGMNAFAHHVPEDGAVVVFYAPHIGITKDGTIGEIHRIGQSENSACCGALKGALSKLLNNQIEPGNVTDLDYQMNTIEQIFLKQADRIKSAENQIFEATEVMYEAINERIETLVSKTNYPCKYVLLIGAIFINGDKDMGSFCSYKKFEYINLETGERKSLMETYYA
ncbi:hypothetical protein J2X31_001336 [Flavobacterium arsenatis]|uniref:Limiting CO2-inducible protein B/C beta carbonyic anhydrase domain-containing protein n=1 Tax=Flavobacterium arsenatis TaxID=1484332 RepID=A0ABU1TMZ1_9FLAO|nr:hypothetical protein [Flavobacterium arsenatis]MDR6967329.1 hypothetical protein [Flavobacterium arsenatis]